MFRRIGFLVILMGTLIAAAEEVQVRSGKYVPFFRDEGEKDQQIESLSIDLYPVTNADYLEFVRKNPEWQKSKVKSIFAGRGYLEHWPSDLKIPQAMRRQPVTGVSWFAARRYCESRGMRLLSTAEWEYAADSQAPENLALILDWYSKPGMLASVSQGKTNTFGIKGMHGLVWEWVDDFSSAIVAGDSRSTNEISKSMFCGSGSLKAKDPSQYATFMRFAFRSSLKANSTGRNLGFRCARAMRKGE
jgi:formylglycine-generating enzyme